MVDGRWSIVDNEEPRALGLGPRNDRSSLVDRRSSLSNHQSPITSARITSHYDVVVAGASFAGLAVAQRSNARVLLVDKDPIGEGQTSACGAPVSIVRAMGADEAIQQIHHELILHTPSGSVVWPLPEPFCTFDYRQFCLLAFAHSDAEFRQAAVLGRRGSTVLTAAGEVTGRLLVDATGWRAALAGGQTLRLRSGQASSYVNRRWTAFGIETELQCDFEPGLHFYFLPEARDGYAWAFPSGSGVRFGVLSYLGRTKLRAALDQFVARFGLRTGEIHGGYLASGLRPPVVDGVFVVGDASGHCLPLTGEGIRTAVLAGFACGSLLQQGLDGHLTGAEAAARYRACVFENRWHYRALLLGNILLLLMPLRATKRLTVLLGTPALLQRFMRHYLGIFQSPPHLHSALEPIDA